MKFVNEERQPNEYYETQSHLRVFLRWCASGLLPFCIDNSTNSKWQSENRKEMATDPFFFPLKKIQRYKLYM